MRPEVRARVLVLAGAVLWGTTGTAQALGPATSSPATVGTVAAIGTAPVATGLLGLAVRRERPETRWGLATLLAVGGCALLVAPVGRVDRVDVLGVVLALGAGVAYAVFAVASKSLLEAGPWSTRWRWPSAAVRCCSCPSWRPVTSPGSPAPPGWPSPHIWGW